MKSKGDNCVLIVDDEPDIRDTMLEALEMNGYHSMAVSGGHEALKALKKLTEEKKSVLVLLDLMMPHMDGFEFIKAKEHIPYLNEVPVVVISADGAAEKKLVGYKIDDCLKKPIDLDKLLETVDKYYGSV